MLSCGRRSSDSLRRHDFGMAQSQAIYPWKSRIEFDFAIDMKTAKTLGLTLSLPF